MSVSFALSDTLSAIANLNSNSIALSIEVTYELRKVENVLTADDHTRGAI